MSKRSVFTQKNIPLALLRFAIPGVITILLAEFYNMVDTFFVGYYAGASHEGAASIGAMSIAFPIQRMIIALSLMIGVGAALAISRARGAEDKEKMRKSIGISVTLGLVILSSVPLSVLLFSEQILTALGARSEIFVQAKIYIKIVVLGTFFLGFTNIFGYEMTALGHPKITLFATFIGALLNVVIDYILVGKYLMGVRGAAIATVFSQGTAFLFTFYMIMFYRKKYGFSLHPKWNFFLGKYILGVGFATFIVEISDAVLIAVLNNILLPIGGNDAVIIVGAITRVSMFMYITIIGISAGMQPLAAYSYGASDYLRLRKIVQITSLIVFGSSAILWACIMIFAGEIIGSFMKNPELFEVTVSVFRYTIRIFPLISLYYVCIYYFQSVGKAGLGFFLSIYRQLLLFIPSIIILSRIFGIKGVWMSYPLSDLISALTGSILLLIYMKRLRKKDKTAREKKKIKEKRSDGRTQMCN